MYNTAYPNDLDGARAEIIEGLGNFVISTCALCGSIPQMVRCLTVIESNSYYKFFVVCPCKAGAPAHSRLAAADNWADGKYYHDKK